MFRVGSKYELSSFPYPSVISRSFVEIHVHFNDAEWASGYLKSAATRRSINSLKPSDAYMCQ